MEEITVKYIDFSDLLDPKVIKGLFYIDFKPTVYSVPRDRTAFTIDGRPVILGNLRYAEIRVEEIDSVCITHEYMADHVDFLDRPSIYADVDPTLGQGAESRNPSSAAPRDPQDKFKWPNDPCWEILGIDRTQLPEDEVVARLIVTKQYRDLAKQHHPDLGGNVDAMKQVIAARGRAEDIFKMSGLFEESRA